LGKNVRKLPGDFLTHTVYAERNTCYRPSVRLAHGQISENWLKLGLCNYCRTV